MATWIVRAMLIPGKLGHVKKMEVGAMPRKMMDGRLFSLSLFPVFLTVVAVGPVSPAL
jgi:hypothetical protein